MQKPLNFDVPTLVLGLQDVINICQQYQAFYGAWPTEMSAEKHFSRAGVPGFSGAMLASAVENGGLGLAKDPAYQELAHRLCMDGHASPELSTINPKYFTSFSPESVATIFSQASVDVVAPGQPAVEPGRVRLSLPAALMDQVIEQSGVNVNNLPEGGDSLKVTVPAAGPVAQFVRKAGMVYRNDPKTMHQHYAVRMERAGSLYAKYEKLTGARFMTDPEPQAVKELVNRLGELTRVAAARHALEQTQALLVAQSQAAATSPRTGAKKEAPAPATAVRRPSPARM